MAKQIESLTVIAKCDLSGKRIAYRRMRCCGFRDLGAERKRGSGMISALLLILVASKVGQGLELSQRKSGRRVSSSPFSNAKNTRVCNPVF